MIAVLALATVLAQPPIEAAVAHCLASGGREIVRASDPAVIPPGLAEGHDVAVTLIDGSGGRAFSYVGSGPGMLSCGIAIYGRVPGDLRRDIEGLVVARHIKPGAPAAWDRVRGVSGTVERYWGVGVAGVAELHRKPSAAAPTLELEDHALLIH